MVTTIAGIDTAGYNGDGRTAVSAKLNLPFGIAADASGSVYIADRGNDRIRKISGGIISTIAGNGTGGYNGDNISATSAEIFDPTGVAVDGAGNVYIADKSNNRVRKVDASGIITTIAGNGTAGFGGDGLPATVSMLNNPRGVATDAAGNVYIADQANQRIRKINIAGIISTIAGSASSGFSGDNGPATLAALQNPYSVAIDASGNIYIADVDNERIRMVDASGIITTFAGTGTGGYNGDGIAATDAQLSEPTGIAVDAMGIVYIADAWNSRIRAVSAGIISTLAGTGVAGYNGDGGIAVTELNIPYGVGLDAGGNIYIADYSNNLARYITRPTILKSVPNPSFIKIYPNPSTGSFTVNITSGIWEQATITIADASGQEVKKITADTNNPIEITLHVPPGIYFLSASTAHGKWDTQIVIEAAK